MIPQWIPASAGMTDWWGYVTLFRHSCAGRNPLPDDYITVYNRKYPHQGRGMNGRTPWQAFKDGLPATDKPSTIKQEENPNSRLIKLPPYVR